MKMVYLFLLRHFLLVKGIVRWFIRHATQGLGEKAALTPLDTKFTCILALNEHGPFAVLSTFISGVSLKREYCL